MSDFRGARGSNTGDDYHELWAARQALRLLDDRDPLEAMTVEGISPGDEASASDSTWDGVDCALYEGGRDASSASRIVLEQLKYSAADPKSPWTVARLVAGKTRRDSVLNRLARAWSGIQKLEPLGTVELALVSNQPFSPLLSNATGTIAAGGIGVPKARPGRGGADEKKFAYATGLDSEDLASFAKSLRFRGNTESRYAVEERLLSDMVGWVDLEIQTAVSDLRQFIRNRMRPEFSGEVITKESVLLGLGVARMGALFPCPPMLKKISDPVPRASVAQAADRILAGQQYHCLHGPAGIGKTTALQQIESALPDQSVMITYDCYGAGTYLDAGALRHRPADAFLQLSNDLATRLRMPILLGPQHIADPARHFVCRLRHAAVAYRAEHPDALIVIAVDAADNAVTAASLRRPTESCFLRDFLTIGDLPQNVCVIVTARTGRLSELELPSHFVPTEIQPFTRSETENYVHQKWAAPGDWLDTFHRLTGGVPRVQSYAMDLGDADAVNAIERLQPGGRTLDQVFREQFEHALVKSGNSSDISKLCAGLITLARPVPISVLTKALSLQKPAVIDVCADMAPAIRLEGDRVSFADEDFEQFVREESSSALEEVTASTANWLYQNCEIDPYAAQHVAGALFTAGRGKDLLNLVEKEPSPKIISDPILRREAEITRLRLAISVCRDAGDVAQAMRFVLIGGEALKTERAIRDLLKENPDLAVRFALETASRLILNDPAQVGSHGAFLFHKRVVDAEKSDRVALREGRRLIQAWLAARVVALETENTSDWRLNLEDVAANVEAALRAAGPMQALDILSSVRPREIRREIARLIVPKLLAQGEGQLLQALLSTDRLRPWEEIFLLVPMAIAGMPIDRDRLAKGLKRIAGPNRLNSEFLSPLINSDALRAWATDTIMSACELLSGHEASTNLVNDILCHILQPCFREISFHSVGGTAQLELVFRAHALRAACRGEKPDAAKLFEPRPEVSEVEIRRRAVYDDQVADRKISQIKDTYYPIYAATAMGLSKKFSPELIEAELEAAAEVCSSNLWRSEEYEYYQFGKSAARAMMILLGTEIEPLRICNVACRIHTGWGSAELEPDRIFFSRLALSNALHEAIVSEIDASVSKILNRRMGAESKSRALLEYSRILLPISPEDASVVFNEAIEATSQLDREIISQLQVLGALFERGGEVIIDRTSAARNLSEAIADASIRLDDEAQLPWGELMTTLGRLNFPIALANAAKWDDAGISGFSHTLAPVLKAGLDTGALDPAEAMALEMMLPHDQGVTSAAIEISSAHSEVERLIEEAAWDTLIRRRQGSAEKLAAQTIEAKSRGHWATALIERQGFLDKLPRAAQRSNACRPALHDGQNRTAPERPVWTRDVLLNADLFGSEMTSTLRSAREAGNYLSTYDVVVWASNSVNFRDRISFLDMLKDVKAPVQSDISQSILSLVEKWNSPSLRKWSETGISDLIVSRLPDFIRYIAYGEENISRAIEKIGLDSTQATDLLLQGIERHGQNLAGEQVFGLIKLISKNLEVHSAAGLGEWYAQRLAERVAFQDRDQKWLEADIPNSAQVAAARFLYACMGDPDLRVRWRAAHGVRRLARLEADTVLSAFVAEYGRREESLFRSPNVDFYWIAARLWFVVAWDRIAAESPKIASDAFRTLLRIAHDYDFPHLIVQSFARDACLKLLQSGHLSLPPAEIVRLEKVGRSQLPVAKARKDQRSGRRAISRDVSRRFDFDTMDSVPYWYDPMLDAFADLSKNQLLAAAEGWIIDRWQYSGAARTFEVDRLRHRISDRDWTLTSNRHGSNPTIERLNNHLEWHGMWCATGELLRTEPLRADADSWFSLENRIARAMLTEAPYWSSDLRGPTPLRPDFWIEPKGALEEWVTLVQEDRLRGELKVTDRPGYILVSGDWRVRTYDRCETIECSSALVESRLAPSLVRTLQTMDTVWEYYVPSEPEEGEGDIEAGPYVMIPWLRSLNSDGGIDHRDPFRGTADLAAWQPGRLVCDACGIQRDLSGAPIWSKPGRRPMFIYEVWGDEHRDDNRSSFATSGRRLLADGDQLQEFLSQAGREVVIKVEIRREEDDNHRGSDSEGGKAAGIYDRVYRLDAAGGLHAAEGCVGTWSGDS